LQLVQITHASSAEGALRRIAALAVRAAGQMTIQDAEEEVRSAIDIVVQLSRENGRRMVKEVVCRSGSPPRRDSIPVLSSLNESSKSKFTHHGRKPL
jgi:Flp pilus assembly CpaF family ATPase